MPERDRSSFTPEAIFDRGPDFTRNSQGVIPKKADMGKAAMLNSVAQGIDAIVPAVERVYEMSIDDDVRGTVHDVNAEFGVDDGDVPESLQNQVGRLEKLRQMQMQGKIKESHYWTRLATEAKRLRSMYPGYQGFVDDKMASIAGARPANRVRALLQQEAQASARASTGESKASKILTSMEMKFPEYLPMDYFDKKKAGQGYSFEDAMSHVQRVRKHKLDVETKKSELARDVALGKRDEAKAGQTLKEVLPKMSAKILNDATSALGNTWTEFNANVQKLQTRQAEGKPFSSQEVAALQGQIGQLKTQLRSQLMAELNRPLGPNTTETLLSTTTDADRKTAIEAAMSQVDLLEEAVVNKDFGLLTWTKAYVETLAYQDQSQLLKHDIFRSMNAVRAIGGSEAVKFMLLKHKNLSALNTVLGSISLSKLMTGTSTMDTEVRRLQESGNANPATFQAMDEQIRQALVDGNDKLIDTLAPTIFNSGFMSDTFMQSLKTGQAESLFTKYTAQPIVDKMFVNPNRWRNYRNWSYRTFNTLLLSQIEDLKQSKSNPNARKDLRWDPKSNQFVYKVKKGDPLLGASPASDLYQDVSAFSIVDKINQNIRSIKPVLAKESTDVNDFIRRLLLSLDINPKLVEGSAFEDLKQAFDASSKEG